MESIWLGAWSGGDRKPDLGCTTNRKESVQEALLFSSLCYPQGEVYSEFLNLKRMFLGHTSRCSGVTPGSFQEAK